jgi:NAD+ kinase
MPAPVCSYHGFAKKLTIQSRSIDAELVVDGAMAFPWVDGDTAILEIFPDDALVTLNLAE